MPDQPLTREDVEVLRNEQWMPIKWARRNHFDGSPQAVSIELMRSPFYTGERYAVRNGLGRCLNKSGEWELEPMPSSRDDAFYERCRFDSFAAAEAAMAGEGEDK